ncbi:MAG: hypothetical protein HQ509_10595 [Candidatus Marinimicrobia bacterium]|nr:hypothetical protein [Candidatus Neomarinimicrobiota bacterium]
MTMDELLHDPEFIELIKQYIDYLKSSVLEINTKLANGEYHDVMKFGHNIKGSGGGYGFMELTDLGKALEIAANDENKEECQKYLDLIEKFVQDKN